MTLSKLPSQAWKRKEVSEQRLPLQHYVGLVVFNDVSRYCFFHSSTLSISVRGRLLLHWFLPTFASEGFSIVLGGRELCWFFSEVLGTAALQVGLFSKHESLSNINLFEKPGNYLPQIWYCNLWILVTLISVPCCRHLPNEVNTKQSSSSVRGKVVSVFVIVFGTSWWAL